MAQFVMEDMVRKARLGGRFSIDSAATSTEEIGELPHPGTLKKLREQGISTHAHHARQVRAIEYGEWDLFVYMDRENLHGLESIFGGDPQKKFVRLLDFLPDDDPATARTWPTRGTPAISTRPIETSSPGVAVCSQSWKASVRGCAGNASMRPWCLGGLSKWAFWDSLRLQCRYQFRAL